MQVRSISFETWLANHSDDHDAKWCRELYPCEVAQRIGELDEALRILKQEESFHDGHGDLEALDVLQRSYGNQALILDAWGRLEEALALHKKEETICLELATGRTYALVRSERPDAAVIVRTRNSSTSI